MKDYYYILGLNRTASKEEIKKAYRKLCLKFHPDQNNGDKFWEARFRDINEAYETLVDDEKKRIYDEKYTATTNEHTQANSQNNDSTFNQESSKTNYTTPPPPQTPTVKEGKPKKWLRSAGSVFLVLLVLGQIYRAIAIYNKDATTDKTPKSLLSTPDSTSTSAVTVTPSETNHGSSGINDSSPNSINTPTAAPAPDDTTHVFEVKWVTGVTEYRSALILFSDKTGIMRVKFFAHGQTNTIEETMRFENTDEGTRLTGYDPVYAGTQTSYSTYYPDNLFMSQDENGNVTFTCVDDSGQTSKCTVTTINGYQNKQDFLTDFNWKLD